MISVLCVDDDSTYLSFEKRCLEEPGALTVTTALSAPEALRAMETSRSDAVVSDYQMTDMDGISFLKILRQKYPALPIIFFTGMCREDFAMDACEIGADYLVKKMQGFYTSV
ncbi:MAG: response regulator [Methanoregula sp.]|nr:response regulator [Methanoregula sp.]